VAERRVSVNGIEWVQRTKPVHVSRTNTVSIPSHPVPGRPHLPTRGLSPQPLRKKVEEVFG